MKRKGLRIDFGRRLRYLRRNRCTVTSQAALARACRVSLNTVGSIERGHRFPSPEVLERLARALGLEVRDLFAFSDGITA